MLAYLDASALVKLISVEPESAALAGHLAGHSLITSRVGLIEVRRALRRTLGAEADVTGGVFDEVAVVELDAEIAERAAAILPPHIRSLHAIHAATALALSSDVDAFVTHDVRLADAARLLGLPVIAPGSGA